MSETKDKIIIAICTCNRPQGLQKCLNSLAAQSLPAEMHISVEILVVDNAPNVENDAAVAKVQNDCSYPIKLIQEPKRGLSEARNTAVAYALEHKASALLFIDDDEEATLGWLETLLHCQKQYRADIVTGAVHDIVPVIVPAWYSDVTIFRHIRHATGKIMQIAYTGNIMIGEKVLRAIEPAFNPLFSAMGGGDEHFSREAKRKGFSIVWCNEAVITSLLPENRANLGWIMRRGFRSGSSWTISHRLLDHHKAFIKIGIYSLFRLGRAVFYLLKSFATCSRASLYSGLFYTAQWIGTLCGCWGINYKEYANNVTANDVSG